MPPVGTSGDLLDRRVASAKTQMMTALGRSLVIVLAAALVLAGLVYGRGLQDDAPRGARQAAGREEADRRADITIEVDRSRPAGTSQLALGVTHGEHSLDPWGDAAAVRRGRALVQRVARRYPEVRHFMVWNEMKGFFDEGLGRWDVESYTRLYNAVHAALKEVDPAIRVGGPYLVLEGTGSRHLGRRGRETARPITARDRYVLDHWLANATGADFVVIDRSVHPSHDTNRYSRAEYLDLTRWFEGVTRQVRRLTPLPVWFAEDYFRDDRDWQVQAAGLASILAGEVRGGGRAFPAFGVYEAFARHFAPGTPLVRARSSSPSRVQVLASPDVTLLINRRPRRLTVRLDGASLRLAPYEVRALRRGG